MKTFGDIFGGEAEVSADAPGRVNLLGEHTDYNEGYVLPTLIPQRTRVSMAREGDKFSAYSANLDEHATFSLEHPPSAQFARYIYGCLQEVAQQGTPIPPLKIHVHSDVPIGVGLSSSAALEVATLRALRELLTLDLDAVAIAKLAQRAEVLHAGVNCGVLDQMASSLLEADSMLFLDTRTLNRELLPLPDNTEILVIDSGISRSLAATKYNERRAECEAAAKQLGLAALRDAVSVDDAARLPDPQRSRARHVICENSRVLRAARGVTAVEFGQLMNASHESLSRDYEVSTPALDELASIMRAQPAVYGAKLTGAGFGGACVALCRRHHARQTALDVLSKYGLSGERGHLLIPPSP